MPNKNDPYILLAVIVAVLFLSLTAQAAPSKKKAWDCIKVTRLQPVGDTAYEIVAENSCDQDFPHLWIALRFLNREGYVIGHCMVGLNDFGAKERFHEMQPAPVHRATKIDVRKILDTPEQQ